MIPEDAFVCYLKVARKMPRLTVTLGVATGVVPSFFTLNRFPCANAVQMIRLYLYIIKITRGNSKRAKKRTSGHSGK